MSCAALANPTRSFRWSIEADPNWVDATGRIASSQELVEVVVGLGRGEAVDHAEGPGRGR